MLIENLANKTKLAMVTVVCSLVACVCICGFCIFICANLVSQERNQVYVLDGSIPFLAERTQQETNFHMEALAHISLFHQYFFNLPPDDSFIKWSLGKALYMADDSALKQKKTMEERNFYADLISSSSSSMIVCDSIVLDDRTKRFDYYGTQIIKRRTNNVKRLLHTSGYLTNVQRSENNPHGLLINMWKTMENIDYQN